MEKVKKVILVSGMSGAGKSSATRILEDMGYHIIDNFPVSLLHALVTRLEESTDPRDSHIALSTNSCDFSDFLHGLKGEGMDVQVLFLEAADNVLIHRYKATRRIHPLLLSNMANTLEEAISEERQMLSNVMERSFVRIDTSFMREAEMKKQLQQYFAKDTVPSFTISFVSFGYKYGVPLDADLMIDVRFLPNPFWVEKLRFHSGDEEEVYRYVMDHPQTKEFIRRLDAFLDYAFAQYGKEGKNHFTVAIGCTGGQHRSVAITNYLFMRYGTKYHCYKSHRDEKEWLHA